MNDAKAIERGFLICLASIIGAILILTVVLHFLRGEGVP